MSAPPGNASSFGSGEGQRVYIFARKILLRNTRIFKQARSLTDAGYAVTVIGILPRGGVTEEERDGYTIVRLPLDPLYARVPRRIRRTALRIRRGRRRIRRMLRVTRFATRRRLRRTLGALLRRHASNRRLRTLRLRFQRRRAQGAYWLGYPLGVTRTGLALAWRLAMGALTEPDSAERVASISRWARVLLSPLILVARLVRAAVQRDSGRSRSLTEFLIERATAALRPFVMPLRSIEYYRVVHHAVTRELGPPDVIHANDLDTLLIAVLLSRRYRAPLVYDAQELYVGIHTLSRWYRWILSMQEHMLIRRAHRTIVVNDAIKEVMERKYKVAIDIVVLNCPPLVEDLVNGGGPTIRELFEVSKDDLVLLYSGALGPNRGLANTIRALEYLEDACLILLGEGVFRTELERLAAGWGVSDRVFFADFVHHLEVPSFISSADIGIIPYENVGVNHYLCSPSKLFHYIMAGLPIACSDFPFLRSVVIENDIGCVFDPSDPLSIAGAVRRLTHPPGVREACKERLRVVRRQYSWEEQEMRFMSVYRSLPRPADSARRAIGAAGRGSRVR